MKKSTGTKVAISQILHTLEKICHAFDIILSQLFVEKESPVSLTKSQAGLLDRWARLDEKQQAVIFQLLDIM